MRTRAQPKTENRPTGSVHLPSPPAVVKNVPLQPSGAASEAVKFKRFNKDFSIADLQPFLLRHGFAPNAAAIAFDLTSDVSFLEQQWALNPNDKQLTLRMALAGPPAQRAKMAKQLVEAFPNDALGHYLLLNSSPEVRSSEDYEKLSALPCSNSRVEDHISLMREAFQDLGYAPTQSAVFATMERHTGMELVSSQLNVLRQLFEPPQATENDLLIAAAATEHLRYQAANSVMSLNAVLSLRQDILSRLDPTIEFGSHGLTIGEELTRINQEFPTFKVISNFDPNDIAPDELPTFLERAYSSGSVVAILRLLEERANGR